VLVACACNSYYYLNVCKYNIDLKKKRMHDALLQFYIYLIAEKIGDDKEDKIRGFNYKEI